MNIFVSFVWIYVFSSLGDVLICFCTLIIQHRYQQVDTSRLSEKLNVILASEKASLSSIRE